MSKRNAFILIHMTDGNRKKKRYVFDATYDRRANMVSAVYFANDSLLPHEQLISDSDDATLDLWHELGKTIVNTPETP